MENPLDKKVRVSWGKLPGANSLIMRTAPSSYVQCGRQFSARAKEMGERDKMVLLPAFRDGEHHATGFAQATAMLPEPRLYLSSGTWDL